MWRAIALLLLLAAVGFGAVPAVAQQGGLWKVESVTARNSLLVRDPQGTLHQVLLAYLSIPAGAQPYADRAAAVLRAQLVGQQVNLRPVGPQGVGYISALVYVKGNNFNEDFLRRGHAWVNPLQRPPPQWKRIQLAAQTTKAGLWATPNPIHPADFEHELESAGAARDTLESMSADPSIVARMKKTYVGRRDTRVYYPYPCTPWFEIADKDLVIFTSLNSAQQSGFKAQPCKAPAPRTSSAEGQRP